MCDMLIPKLNLIRDRKYLDWVRQQPCVITGKTGEDIDPSHIRYGVYAAAMKPCDSLVVPLSNELHQLSHRGNGEVAFWCTYLPENPDLLMRALKAHARENYRSYLEGK